MATIQIPTTAPVNKIAVGTIFVSMDTRRVLLNLRAPYKTHAMCWSLWGGMMEDDEQPRTSLMRELEEEMGAVPDIERVYPFDVYQSKDKHFKYYSFVCIVKEEFVPVLNKESCGYAWIDLGQWPKSMHQGAKISFCNEKAIEKINSLLKEHQLDN